MDFLKFNKAVIDSFITSLIVDKRSTSMIRGYRCDCNKLTEYLELKNKSITSIFNQREFSIYEHELHMQGLAKRTILRRLAAIRALQRYCVQNGITAENIQVKSTTTAPKVNRASDNIIATLYNYCTTINKLDKYIDARRKMEILLVIICGLKANQICNLKISDIEDKDSPIYLYAEAFSEYWNTYMDCRKKYMELQSYKSDSAFVGRFESIHGGTLLADFKIVLRKANIKDNIQLGYIRNNVIYRYSKVVDRNMVKEMFNLSTTGWIQQVVN